MVYRIYVVMFGLLAMLLSACMPGEEVVNSQASERMAEGRATMEGASAPSPAPIQTAANATPESPTGAPDQPVPASLDLSGVAVTLEPVAEGLSKPVGITGSNDGSNRLFVIEKNGWISIVAGGQFVETPFLDIQDLVGADGSEQGLLGLAFHPDYRENGSFFVNYTDENGDTVIARYRVSNDPNLADPASAQVLLTIDQPAANHNGGHLAFGPDGYLYIGMGDGGGAGDRFGNGQNADTLLGKMLRIDVDNGDPYTIPADNPYQNAEGVRPEIWATGLRNPWRYSFDRQTGDLFIADVGQNAYEEINFQPAGSSGGENYGWPITEASDCFQSESCTTNGLIMPINEYSHDLGCSVTGGHIYRGSNYPQLNGAYIFGDYCSGRIWGIAPAADGSWARSELAETDLRISAFGEDEAGELYLVSLNDTALYRVTLNP